LTLFVLSIIVETGVDSEFFRDYSGVLCQQLDFELLDDGLIIKLSQASDDIRYKHSYIEHHFFKRAQQSNQALLKSCNNKQRNIKTILDLTGGWGMDSFILACHGQSVTSIEQNELVHMIGLYSLKCARDKKHSMAAANRISMIYGDSVDYLQNCENTAQYDCIYLDPMFPEHKSSAKSAKALQILQKLTQNQDIQKCFELALAKASKRVVVKCPAKSSALFEKKPDLVYREKTIRFDVYLTT
jgi:16S rRNA (guanine1516-N2)-methyltransferase